MYPFICQSDSISPSRLNFPYQEVLLSWFLSLTLPHSSFFFFFFFSTYYRDTNYLLSCSVCLPCQATSSSKMGRTSTVWFTTDLQPWTQCLPLNIEWVNNECLNLPLILYGLRHLIYVCTSVFPHIIFLEIYNLQSTFTVFVVSVKKAEQMSLSLRYNWKKNKVLFF